MHSFSGYEVNIKGGPSMYHLVLFDEKAFIRNRIKSILSVTDIRVHEATSYGQLVSLVDHDTFSVDMVMADINFDDPILIDKMKSFREEHRSVPLVIFTSFSSRKVFVNAMKLGANDFVLKSVEDDILVSRIKKNIGLTMPASSPGNPGDKISIDITRYLAGEIRKAQKGDYTLTICFSSVLGNDGSEAGIRVSPRFLAQLQGTYWETDALVSLGENHFVSFFPFCGQNGKIIVESKLQSIFETLKSSDANLENCNLINDYVTFPEDGMTKEDILTKMIEEMNS